MVTAKYPQRTLTHTIDTKAVRRLITTLSEDWLIRDLSDRDYGIDLKLEYFDGISPTGIIIFLQVKGTDKVIKGRDGIVTFRSFPIHTLNYSNLFPEPFFLVYLSTKEHEPIYFLWLQKYISYEQEKLLNLKTIQKSVSLKIPSKNNLCTDFGKQKFKEIANSNLITMSTLNFLKDNAIWDSLYINFKSDMSNKTELIKCTEKLEAYSNLYAHLFYGQTQPFIDFQERIKDIKLIVNLSDDSERVVRLDELQNSLKTYAEMLLNNIISEEFIDEQTGEKPY